MEFGLVSSARKPTKDIDPGTCSAWLSHIMHSASFHHVDGHVKTSMLLYKCFTGLFLFLFFCSGDEHFWFQNLMIPFLKKYRTI